MARAGFEAPVTESVAKINGELAVGEDMDFQRRWWRFERVVWSFFVVVILLDLAGAFGRGPLANAEARTADGTLEATYERIERTGTPSMMTVTVSDAADARELELFVSDSGIGKLGLQRVIPAPLRSRIGDGGLTYAFPRGSLPAIVRFEFQPTAAGLYHVRVGEAGRPLMTLTIAVVP